ncbi:MAG TPA: NAD(P)H-hydrate dehydratase [Candidatus Binatia bacterium]|nr:NAD(P)H-hydrate dehydratase [Candidatus Binatia bacterium]
MIVTTAAEMRALDRWTIAHGTPGHVLMERAGAGAARVLRERLPAARGRAVVVCGRGNNGGDGFVVARHLKRARFQVETWLLGRPDAVRGDAARMLAAWRRAGGRVESLADDARLGTLRARLARAAVVVDAILGTGLDEPVAGLTAAVIEAINAAPAPVLAIDLPSGLSADTGRPLGTAVRAAVTATFGFAKVGQCIHPGIEHTGSLAVVDIGIPPEAVAAVRPRTALLEAHEVGRLLPARGRDAHKGSFGHVLVIAGSRGKTGAALLAAEGAARSGAGLTTLAAAAALQPLLEGHVREAMTAALPDGPDGTAALGDGTAVDRLLAGRAAVVCGPGLGLAEGTRALVAHVVRRCSAPLVLDADALNSVAGTDVLAARPGPTVLTPHPGEMARLVGADTATVQADRLGVARRLAAAAGVVVVLKGARTVVASPDGGAVICPTGNPGMASGGTGDVLSGIVGGLLAQGLGPADAAALGVFAHGLAGDTVAARRGEVGLLARDLLAELPPTLAGLQAAAAGRKERHADA